MHISDQGLELIKNQERFRARAYQDIAGVWTIGYGSTKGVQPGDTITHADALQRLQAELAEYENAVTIATAGIATQSQFDALTSLAYNIGAPGLRGSSVIKAHRRGDWQAAARAFALWNKARVNGKLRPVTGLTRRRALEAALYLQDTPDADPSMPDAAPERPMRDSEINRAGIAAGGTAAVATVAETARAVSDVKYSALQLGDWLLPLLLVAVVALCGYIVWQRIRQRREGWS